MIEVNITSRNEHVPEIERKIRVVKERTRCIKADTGLNEIPSIMIKQMVLHTVLFLNSYVDKQGFQESTPQGNSYSAGNSAGRNMQVSLWIIWRSIQRSGCDGHQHPAATIEDI